jgi:hypothetical protein
MQKDVGGSGHGLILGTLPGGTEENHKKPVNIAGPQLRFEPAASWIQSSRATHLTTTSGAGQVTIQLCTTMCYYEVAFFRNKIS